MRKNLNVIAAYSIMMGLILLVGFLQSWNMALSIFNLCLISAVMTMGANIQWGYAGLINFGISSGKNCPSPSIVTTTSASIFFA